MTESGEVSKKKTRYISVFDSLRAFAVLGVFVAHLNFFAGTGLEFGYHMLSYARFGVDFFFVLSGFVLAMNYSQKFRKGFALKDYLAFVIKRIRKIYPVYLAVIIYGVIRFIIKDNYVSIAEITKKLIASIALLQSAVPFQGWATAFSGATWFLSCIFVLYLVTPLVLKKTKKITVKRTFINTVIIFVAFNVVYMCFHIMQYYKFPNLNLSLVYSSPYINIFPFLLGINCYLFFEAQLNHAKIINHINSMELIVSIGTVCWCLISETVTMPVIITYNINMLISICLISVFVYQEGKVTKLLNNKAMQRLGEISFEFYLTHYLIVTDAYAILSKRFAFTEAGMVAFTVAAFIVTYILAKTLHSLFKS